MPKEQAFYDAGYWLFVVNVGKINGEYTHQEEKALNLKRWFFLFWTTLLIGAVGAVATGMGLLLNDQKVDILGLSEVGFNVFSMSLVGMTISIISQMGFFAYLTVNYFANGFFRRKSTWNFVQLFAILVALFELGFLRYLRAEADQWLPYYDISVVLLLVSLAVAYWKSKMTNKSAFIPTLFFMTTLTTLEAVPALQQNNNTTILFMMLPLFICNAYQILMLHRLVKSRREPSAAVAK